jgi:hypothetical protein
MKEIQQKIGIKYNKGKSSNKSTNQPTNQTSKQ